MSRGYWSTSPLASEAAVVARMRTVVPDERLLFLMELSVEPVHSALRAGPA